MTIAPASPLTPAGGISTDRRRTSSRANLEAAGQQFEAVFTGMMLKSMRQAKLTDGLFDDSQGMQTFQDMQDTQLATSMAQHTPLGIGKAMVDFLARNQTPLQADGAASAAPDGSAS